MVDRLLIPVHSFEVDDAPHRANLRALEAWAIQVQTALAAPTWTTLQKLTDETRTSTIVMAADNTLHFPMEASATYRIRGLAAFNAPAAPDIKFSFVGPASPTFVAMSMEYMDVATAIWNDLFVSGYANDLLILSAIANEGLFRWDGIVINGTNTTPDFALEYAQNTSSATASTVKKGSYMEYAKVV